MKSIAIREACAADSKAIAELVRELGYPIEPSEVTSCIEQYAESAGSIVLVAVDGDEVTGFISFHCIPLFHRPSNLGRITALCVASSRKREGIGKALLDRLDPIAVEHGCERIEVTSGDSRAHDAHLFYQSCGYEIESRRFLKTL